MRDHRALALGTYNRVDPLLIMDRDPELQDLSHVLEVTKFSEENGDVLYLGVAIQYGPVS